MKSVRKISKFTARYYRTHLCSAYTACDFIVLRHENHPSTCFCFYNHILAFYTDTNCAVSIIVNILMQSRCKCGTFCYRYSSFVQQGCNLKSFLLSFYDIYIYMVTLNKLQFGVHTVHGKPMHLLLLCLKFSFFFLQSCFCLICYGNNKVWIKHYIVIIMKV